MCSHRLSAVPTTSTLLSPTSIRLTTSILAFVIIASALTTTTTTTTTIGNVDNKIHTASGDEAVVLLLPNFHVHLAEASAGSDKDSESTSKNNKDADNDDEDDGDISGPRKTGKQQRAQVDENLNRRLEVNSQSQSSGYIELSDANYFNIVLNSPRPYGALVMFSAAASTGCQLCGEYEMALEELATSYQNALKAGKTEWSMASVASKLADAEDRDMKEVIDSNPLVFGLIKFERSKRAFQEHSLTRVPLVVYFPPLLSAKPRSSMKDLEKLNQFPIKEGVSAEELQRFLQAQSGVRFEIYRSPFYRVMAFLFFLLMFLSVAQKIAIRVVPAMRASAKPWLILSLTIYFFAVSGGAYSLIRSPPSIGMGPDRRPMFFSRGRDQYVYEGIFMGLLNLIGALGVMLAMKGIPPKFRDILGATTGQVLGVVGFGIFILAFKVTISVYRNKQPGYLGGGTGIYVPGPMLFPWTWP